ncbi:MAG: cytochrome c oxidase subunit 3 [Bacteroidia bacterium]
MIQEQTYTGIKSYRILLWFAMVSMLMIFGAYTSAYIVRMSDGNWTIFQLPKMFLYSTITILLSSIPMQFSVYAAKRNRTDLVKTSLLFTFGLGLIFVLLQFLGWIDMIHRNLFFVANDPSTSFVYVISGVHLAHLAGGIIYLVYVNYNALFEKYNSGNYFALTQCATFWHFLGGLWLYLYLFLLYAGK